MSLYTKSYEEILKNKPWSSAIIPQNSESRAVFRGAHSDEAMRNTIGVLKLVSQGEADIRNGKALSQETVFKKLLPLGAINI